MLSTEAETLLAELRRDHGKQILADLVNPAPDVVELLEAGKIEKCGAMIVDSWGTGRSSHTAIYKLVE